MLDKQTTTREYYDVALPPREFYASDAVWVMNFAGMPKLTDVRFWRRHMDHIRLRIPEDSDGDAGKVLPMSTGGRAFMGEKKARDVQAPTLVRVSVTTVDHPVGLTGPTGGEVAPTDVNQSSDVCTLTEVADKAVAESTELRRSTRVRKQFF